MDSRFTLNTEQIERMAGQIRRLNWQRPNYETINNAIPANYEADATMDYLFYTSMLLFDFKGMEAVLPDNTYIKGTDVFFYLARQAGEANPDFWTADGLVSMSEEDYYAAFSLDHNPIMPDLPRMDERIALLRDAALTLKTHWNGKVSHLLAAHPRLRDDDEGLLDVLLRTFKGYSDPLFKKAFVFLKALDVLKLWQPQDPENVQIPVDYHVIRLALRNGTVTIRDKKLAKRLREGEPVTEADEHALRLVIMDAYRALVRESGMSVYLVDEIFWLVGRSCCHYKRPPRCSSCDFTDCTVQPAFNYTCPGRCPLADTCLGAQHKSYRTLLEPNIVTIHY